MTKQCDEHTPLFMDSINGPERLTPCIFCQREQLRGSLTLAEEGLASAMQEIERLRAAIWAEIKRYTGSSEKPPQGLVDALNNVIPAVEPLPFALAYSADVRQEIKGKGDVPDSQFAGILKAAESGDAVNTMDLINALWWRVGNQRRELARKNADIERLKNDCQELTCGDPSLVSTAVKSAGISLANFSTVTGCKPRPCPHGKVWLIGDQTCLCESLKSSVPLPGGQPLNEFVASLIVSEEEAKKPTHFRHWSKDPAVPYANCHCGTCSQRTNEG